MFGLQKHGPDGRYGVILDVGSASIAVAIVSSDPTQPLPTVIWSYKDRLSIDTEGHYTTLAKNIAAAAMNAILTVGSEGVKALRSYDPHGALAHAEVSVSAPWSYTITRTVSSTAEEPFLITRSLLEELIRVADEESLHILNENELLTKLGLEVVASSTVDTNVNGYSVVDPIGQKVSSIVLSRLIGVVQKQLESTITESFNKVSPKTDLRLHTFMFQFATVLREIDPNNTELCLIDIGGEATEIGIIRDSVLRYVTHQPEGHNSIVRAIASCTGSPHEEVLHALKHDFEAFKEAFGKEKQLQIEEAIANFDISIADLFNRTGDSLSIPKSIYIHCDTGFDDFFVARFKEASEKATNISHTAISVTNKIFQQPHDSETKILLSCYVFHKKLNDAHITTN